MQKESRKKEKEERKNELYAGGRQKELVWIALIEELTFNKPIQTALWNNEEEEINALENPQGPHWGWFEFRYVGPSPWAGGWFELVGNGMINGFNHVEPTEGAPPEKGLK